MDVGIRAYSVPVFILALDFVNNVKWTRLDSRRHLSINYNVVVIAAVAIYYAVAKKGTIYDLQCE